MLAVAAEPGKCVLAAFFQQGRLTWDGGQLEVDQPCLALLDLAAAGGPRLTIAEPTHKLPAIVAGAMGRQPRRIEMPTGLLAGKSVTVSLGSAR